MKLAIVEDDQNIADLIKIIFADQFTVIDHYTNGTQAIDAIISQNYNLVILDLMLPGVNGLEICRKIRSKGLNLPILMLTAKNQENDKVDGLEIGADDYMTKPFSNKELQARVKALIRRSSSTTRDEKVINEVIQIGDITINPISRSVIVGMKEISVTPKEFELLYLFMANAGRSFSRVELLARIWGDHFDGLEHTVNSNINRLRLKIEKDPANPVYLQTVWGLGYKFIKYK